MKNNIKYYTLALLGLLIFAPTFASAATPSRPSTQDIAVYLIGDSTVDFYPASRYPLTGWGMPFGDSFQPNVRVLNHAESGRSTRTFISDGRWQTVVNALRIADYVLIQFGHNDEVTGGRAYTSPADYKTNLIKFVTETRAKQAIPVLITPVSRRSFSGNTAVQSHPIYSPIVRSVAAEHNVILIDLDSLSIALNQQYGPEGAKALYLYTSPGQYPAYPNGIKDDNHFSAFGAWKIADLVLADLKRMGSELAAHQPGAVTPPQRLRTIGKSLAQRWRACFFLLVAFNVTRRTELSQY